MIKGFEQLMGLSLCASMAWGSTTFTNAGGDISSANNWSDGLPLLGNQGVISLSAVRMADVDMNGWDVVVAAGGAVQDTTGDFSVGELRGASVLKIDAGGEYVRSSGSMRISEGARVEVAGGVMEVGGLVGLAGGFEILVSGGSLTCANSMNYNSFDAMEKLLTVTGGVASFGVGTSASQPIDDPNVHCRVEGGHLIVNDISFSDAVDDTNIIVTISGNGRLTTHHFDVNSNATARAERYLNFATDDPSASWVWTGKDAADFESKWKEGSLRHKGTSGLSGAVFGDHFMVVGDRVSPSRVTGCEPIRDIVVSEGISRENLPLPHVVVVTQDSLGTRKKRVDVFPSEQEGDGWGEVASEFDGNVPGTYSFKLRSFSDKTLSNFDGIYPELKVVVEEAGIRSFDVIGQVGESLINASEKSVRVRVLPGTDLGKVKPVITLSDYASCLPTLNEEVDFSTGSVRYEITSRSGNTYQWTVEVAHADVIQQYIYVSPDGDDAGSGDSTSPYKTLSRARDHVRTINTNMTGDVVVYLRGGIYPVSEEIRLDRRDSGGNGFNVVYAAYPGEKPVLRAGVAVTNWVSAASEIPGAYKAAAPPEVEYSRELYVNGRRATVARDEGTTVNGWAGYDNPDMDWFDGDSYPKTVGKYSVREGYRTTEGYAYNDMTTWRNVSDVEFGYLVGWTFHLIPVRSASPDEDGAGIVIKMNTNAFELVQTGIGGSLAIKDPNFVQNAFELLDAPGESYFDRASKTIYYIPREGEDIHMVDTYLPVSEKIIVGEGEAGLPIERLVFDGIAFECTANNIPVSDSGAITGQASFRKTTQGTAKTPGVVRFNYASNIRLQSCDFRMIGLGAVDFDLEARSNVVIDCVFDGIGASAIQVGNGYYGKFDSEDKAVSDNAILANKVYNIGESYNGAIGIWVACAKNTIISRNDMNHISYSAISCGWSWGGADPTIAAGNVIEYNHVRNALEKLHDGAGIYTLGYQPGSRICGNHVQHNVHGGPGGIYLDEGSSGYVDISENVVYDISNSQKDCFFFNYNVGYWGAQADRYAMVERMNSVMRDNFPHDQFTYPGTSNRINPPEPDMSELFVSNTISRAGNPSSYMFHENLIVKPGAIIGREYDGTLLSNATSLHGGALRFEKITGPDWLVLNPDGSLSGAPGVADGGINVFMVEATDGFPGNSDTTSLVVDVRPEYGGPGYVWDWRKDFVIASSGYSNPQEDAGGRPGVWRYAYATNGTETASSRNHGRMNLEDAVHGSDNGIWSSVPDNWSSSNAAFVRGSSSGTFHVSGGSYVGGKASLAQVVWKAPVDALIRIHGVVKENQPVLGAGFTWYIDVKKDGFFSELKRGTLNDESSGSSSQFVDETIYFRAGDEIIFSVDANGGSYNDRAEYEVVYEVVAPYVNPYITGYRWNWMDDFIVSSSGYSNPEKDGEGVANVWTYAYNTNGVFSASARNVHRLLLSDVIHSDVNGIWASEPDSWSAHTSSFIRGNADGEGFFHITGGSDVGNEKQVAQLVWTAPVDANIRIKGIVSENQPSLGNGFAWYIDTCLRGVYSRLVDGVLNDTASGVSSQSVDEVVSVWAGDEIVFSVHANGSSYNDRAEYHVEYEVVPYTSAAGYDEWIKTFSGLAGLDAAYDADPDGDGLSNLLEFAIGGDPSGPSDDDVELSQPILTEVSGEIVWEYSFPRRVDYSSRGMRYFVEVCESLGAAAWEEAVYSIVNVRRVNDEFEEITARLATAHSNAFARIGVTIGN